MASAPDIQPPPLELPEGTCQRVAAGSPWYWVKGSRDWYLVSADTGECQCKDFVFRCRFTRQDWCKHGRFLARHLEQQNECPTCHGQGCVRASGVIRYVDRHGNRDREPLPCVVCGGSGRRSDAREG